MPQPPLAVRGSVWRPIVTCFTELDALLRYVQADTLPQNNAAEWSQIAWSGGAPVPGNPNRRRGSASKRSFKAEASAPGLRTGSHPR